MIKTIVFDLGGVYFGPGTKSMLEKLYKILGVSKETIDETFLGHYGKDASLYMKGKISREEFWEGVAKKLKIKKEMIPKFQQIWYSAYKPIKGMRKLVLELRKNYRVIAFSGNTEGRIEYLDKKYGLNNDFDAFVLSFDIGFGKGEVEFCEALLKKINCKPEECAYVDNTQRFLDVAKQFGIKTILFKNAEQVRQDLKKFGVEI